MKILFLFSFTFLILNCRICFSQVNNEQGAPFMQSYTPKDYNGNAQIWSCIQDNRGMMYFGDGKQIIEFDGKNWNIISDDNNSAVRSLNVDSSGRIYVGAVNEFGFLQPNSSGQMQYHSLSVKLPLNDRKFLEIYKIFVNSSGVYFVSLKNVYRLFKDRIQVIRTDLRGFGGFEVNGAIYLTHRNLGLCQLKDTTLIPLNLQEAFTSGISFPNNKILLTSGLGNWCIFDPVHNTTEKFDTPALPYFNNHTDYFLSRINEEKFAVATKTGGIVILSNSGSIVQVINQQRGLFPGQVYTLLLDHDRNLWAGMSKGIAKIDINFPVLKFDARQNVNEYVLSTINYNKRRYIGTLDGISYLPEFKINPGNDNHSFIKIKSFLGSCWDLETYQDVLFGVGNSGIRVIKDTLTRNIFQPTPAGTIYCLVSSPKFPNVLFAGMNGQMAYLKLNQFKDFKDVSVLESYAFPGIKEKIKKILCDRQGNLWATTANEGLYFIRFTDQDLKNCKITLLGKRNGLENTLEPHAFLFNDEVMVATDNGIHKVVFPDRTSICDSLIQMKRISLFGERTNQSIGQVLKFDENSYFLKGSSIFFASKTGDKFRIDSCGFRRLKNSYQTYLVNVGIDKNISFCTDIAFLYYNTGERRDFGKSYDVLLRKVTIGKDSLLFNGAFFSSNDSLFIPTVKQTGSFKPVISYQYNSVTFQFAAMFYEEPENTHYRFKLEGFDKECSQLSNDNKAVFTNLPEGDYTFKIQAVNVYGYESNISEYTFSILPPWYREWWAFAIYIILFIALTALITYGYTRRLIKQKKFLKTLVKNLKIEMRVRKEAEIKLIAMKDRAEESDRLKTAFLAMMNHELRTPLNHIIGFSELIISAAAPEEDASFATTIQQSGKSLLSYIEDVFDLALVEKENIKLRLQTFTLEEIFTENMEALDILLSESGKDDQINLNFHPDKDWILASLAADKNKINKVLTNLFKNAVKFTDQGNIEFGFRVEENHKLIFYISDTGIGIPEEKQELIFQFFRQGDDSTTKAYGGIGIGLAISRKIANILKGELKVDSRPDLGSTFTFSIPVELYRPF